jgi:hypothetical protein
VAEEISKYKLDLVRVLEVRWDGGEYSCPQIGDKTDNMKDKFCEELEHVFDKFPKYHMKILLGHFNAKVGREDIFKPRE